MAIARWIRMGLVPGLWGLIGGGVVGTLAIAMGVDESLARGIGMLATIAIAEWLRQRIRDAAERDDASRWESNPHDYEEPESAHHWRR
jgi:hypothetical protein